MAHLDLPTPNDPKQAPLVRRLNQLLRELAQRLSRLEGVDGMSPLFRAAPDLNQNRITNVARSKEKSDVVTRQELLDLGLVFDKQTSTLMVKGNIAASGGLITSSATLAGAVPRLDQLRPPTTLTNQPIPHGPTLLTGTMDGVNTSFACPFPLFLDSLGVPFADLWLARTPLFYTTSTPNPGEWTYSQAISHTGIIGLGDAPLLNDPTLYPLYFRLALEDPT